MAQNHVDLRTTTASVRSLPRVNRRPPPGSRLAERHIVVATQNLPRMSGAIQALIHAGYLVTAYASPTRLLPRLHRWNSPPVSLLVIDGGLTPAFGRAAAIAARSIYVDLPILLLANASATRCSDFMPSGVSVLPMPLSDLGLLARVAELAPQPDRAFDEPPDKARAVARAPA
jgi:hypothetical protein